MSDSFEFTAVRLHKPCDNLATAIGIIQAEILAADSNLNREVMFGNFHFKRVGLEAAVAMLVALCEPLENAAWDGKDA